ncbi:hypothetical protein PIB30_058430 [Stylosanthes scabra]|uniref:Uncharacterized protein n=1 Tax=Stylosanthes scabra TaxID=79078 RepID=A0ABU6YMG1_9FABA|nr:hypothetical protein [Stylosanthes scabra]
MLRKRWVKKLDDLISTFWFLQFAHHLVGKDLLAGVTDLEAKNCHKQVRDELAYTKLRGANLGAQVLVRVCESVCVGAQALKTGAWALVGECMWGRKMLGAQALKTGAWALGVCFGCARSVCGHPGASFGRLDVSVVVQEGGVGVLEALGAGFGRLGAQLSAALSCGVSGLKSIVNYRVLYIDAKPQMLTL